MAKTWFLETHTKGTGANIVPLDGDDEQPARERERDVVFVHPPAARAPKPPEPKRPHVFKVLEITTGRVLAEGASARATVELLRDVRSVVDVAISVLSEKDGRYRLLTHGEQKTLWDLRGAGPAPRAPGQAAGAQP
jgi:hypothetical protein